MKAYRLLCLTFSTLALASTASATELCGDNFQGEILKGSAPDAKKVIFNDKQISISENGDFLIAFGRDEKPEQSIIIDGKTYKIDVSPQKWDIQNIKGLPPKKVTPSEDDQKAIARERTEIRGAQTEDTLDTYWEKGFIKPVEGRISGTFGGQRILNGEKRNPHQGLDIAALEGTDIKSSGDGIVTLAGYDYFYSGNVVVVDHGHKLFTIYAHMKDISVKAGDIVSQGDIIGTVGKTGRATGPHLHWGASLNSIRFDPSSLLKLKNNKNCFSL
ncbi:MAG: M23 family metallopeptidase [Lactobacillus sp.]|jgi:murein DD-endopeptidase MepM/ murein hydrolase activator NlpD|nr:M23 family metallopeptidase [Lactobacillus sp.]